MSPSESRVVMLQLIAEAHALRAAFPAAMRDLTVSALPPRTGGDGPEAAALRYLRDEMLLVRAGKVVDLTVLDDEIAHVERVLVSR